MSYHRNGFRCGFRYVSGWCTDVHGILPRWIRDRRHSVAQVTSLELGSAEELETLDLSCAALLELDLSACGSRLVNLVLHAPAADPCVLPSRSAPIRW